MIVKAFLTLVGVLYLVLALWCTALPAKTSQHVGFALQGGSGQSEFMAVYGGLEFGMALLFLLPLVRPDSTSVVLLACLLIHGSLVLFRSAAFLRFDDIGSTTITLAIVEWVLALGSLTLWLRRSA